MVTQPNIPVPSSQEVLVKTEISAMSPGTEMLLYRDLMPSDYQGDFDDGQNFSYPTTFGYASVGVVDAFGDDIDPNQGARAKDIREHMPRRRRSRSRSSQRLVIDDNEEDILKIGTRVFSFQPHTSHYVAKPEVMMRVPENIASQDAVFLPFVETALCLAHDAHPRPGESVCIFGQGVVGLLLSKTLKFLYPFSRLLSVEPVRARRSISLCYGGVDASITPREARRDNSDVIKALGTSKGADVIIELSGQSSGYEQCMELVREHGTIIVGSWYSNRNSRPASMMQHPNWHRSAVTVKPSQVSKIRPALSGRWSKERRFRLAWKLLTVLKPSELVRQGCIELFEVEDAAQAYRNIDDRQLLQAIFKY